MTLIKTSKTRDFFSRRSFLRALGASAAFLPLLDSERAEAASSSGYPKRLVTMAWSNGIALTLFYPPTDTDPTASQILAPLAPLRSKVLVVAGVDYSVVPDEHKFDGHNMFPVMYTGSYKNISDGTNLQLCTALNPSLDQVVSDSVAKQVSLPIPLLNITLANGLSTSFSAAQQRSTGESKPDRLFNKLFASGNLTASQASLARARSKSVLDFVQGELSTFGQRMGTDDRAKIDAHLAAIRQIEMDLSAATVSCSPPTTDTENMGFDVQVKAMMDIVGAAFRCDLTRSVSMVLGDDFGDGPSAFPFIGLTADYHSIAHLGPSGYDQKVKIDIWYYKQVAYLATLLDSIKEGDRSVLDNSVIIAGTDMQEGSYHYTKGMQFTIVGSGGGYFKTGRVVRVGPWKNATGASFLQASDVAHNKVLASVGNAMGVSMTGFGSISGTLDELKA